MQGFLTAHVEEGKKLFTLQVQHAFYKMRMAGTNLAHACLDATEWHQSLMFLAPEKGQTGVIALRLVAKKERLRGDAEVNIYQFLIGVYWRDDKLIVDLNDQFIPVDKRLASVGEAVFCVRYGEETFASWDKEFPSRAPKYARFVDGDTLCHFLAGDINLDVLRAVAEKIEAEQTAREKLAHLSADLAEAEGSLQTLRDELHAEQEQHIATRSALSIARADLIDAKRTVGQLSQVWRGIGKALVECLGEFMKACNPKDESAIDPAQFASAVAKFKKLNDDLKNLANRGESAPRIPWCPEMDMHYEFGDSKKEG